MKFLYMILFSCAMLCLMACGKEEPAAQEDVPPPPRGISGYGMGSLGGGSDGGNVNTTTTIGTPSATVTTVKTTTFTDTVAEGFAVKIEEEHIVPQVIDSSMRNVQEMVVGEEGADALNPLAEKRRDGIVVILPTPAGSLADKLAKKSVADKKLLWRPLTRSGGEFLGHPWLTVGALSADKTVLAVIERTGADGGPYGSRLVLINTCDFSILRVHELETLVESLGFCGERSSIFALCAAQKSLLQSKRIVEIDLNDGALKQSLDLSSENYAMLLVASAQNKVMVRRMGMPELEVYPLNNLAPAEKRIVKLESDDALPALTGDGASLAVFTPGLCALYDLNDLSAYRSFKLPANAKFDRVWGIGDRARWIVKQGEQFAYLNESQKSDIGGRAGDLVIVAGTSELYLEEKVGNVLRAYKQFPFAGTNDKIEPMRMFPRSATSAFFADYIPHGNRILYFDKSGALWLYAKRPKGDNWSKIQIIAPSR